ncbi:uncharacterized protein RB166_014795 [Leptodactylus fuscus]|uniref:uncharacterized protein LOC142214492 n=1 Tax=Leptodactylus fuscus TaxID=238119 RepID=UPI003F4E4EB2
MEGEGRRSRILQFNVGNNSSAENGYTRVLLQLFGYLGHGKSSFINSCIYTLGNGAYEMKAKALPLHEGCTTERLAYRLTDCITIVDNRGYGTMEEKETGETYAQLGNFLPLNQGVEWEKDFLKILSKVEDSDVTPNYSDFIVPMFIYSAKSDLFGEDFSYVKEFFKNCRNMTGVYPIVVLTNKLSEYCSKNYNTLVTKFKAFGAEQIYAIENYTEEDHIKTRGRCDDLQAIIENALKDVKFRLEQPRDPVKERIERKKFVLKFAYQFSVAKKEEEAAKKEKARLKEKYDKMWFKKFPE